MTDILKPILWFAIILALLVFIGNRELQYRAQISEQDKQIERLMKDYRNSQLMLKDCHTLGRHIWSQPIEVNGWMDAQWFLRRLVAELEASGECNVVINKNEGEKEQHAK